MSAYLNPGHILPKMKEINIKLQVNIKLKDRDLTMRHLSRLMGKSPDYLQKQLSKKETDMSVLLALSQHLQTNLLELYTNLLPEHLRPTAREKLLGQQLATQQQQITTLEKERDFYKAVAMK